MKQMSFMGLCLSVVCSVASAGLYLDFGSTALTEGPDANGNYWNNVAITSAGASTGLLVDDANNVTGVDLVFLTDSYATNSGALADPDPNLLGDLAIATVTGDYHAQLGSYGYGPTSFQLTGLNPDSRYVLSIYGGRLGGDANDVRITQFDVQGVIAELQTTGPIGDPNGSFANGNDSTVLVTDTVAPDANGVIEVTFVAVEGGIGYLSAMKVNEVSSVMLVDFGATPTEGADSNGNYWNSVVGTAITNDDNPALNLVDDANNPMDVTYIQLDEAYATNSGSLVDPDPNLLGDLAVGTATGDYHAQLFAGYGVPPISFLLAGLDPNQSYVMSFYAGRDAEEVRVTQFDVLGTNADVGTLQTSGVGIGVSPDYANGNDSVVLVTKPIVPDENGEILVTYGVIEGSYGYLGAMKVVAF